jgi:hypothetical protein
MIRIRTSTLLAILAAAAAVSLVAASAEAGVSLPGGGYAETSIGCDSVLRTLDVTTTGPSSAYYMLWAKEYGTGGQWQRLTPWRKLSDYSAVGPVSGAQRWYAFYVQYASYVNGRWRTDLGEWVRVTYKFEGTTGWWCNV